MLDLDRLSTMVSRSMHLSDEDAGYDLREDIMAALEDMYRVGITAVDVIGDAGSPKLISPLLTRCVEMYVKWQHSYLGEPERFRQHYERLRDSLSMGSAYNAEN